MDNKICIDCANLRKIKGELACEECFNQLIKDLDECPLGITVEELDNINQHAKENKVKIVARADGKKKERKPREKKQDLDKEFLISMLAEGMKETCENVEITNSTKFVCFDYNGKYFKINLIRQTEKTADKKEKVVTESKDADKKFLIENIFKAIENFGITDIEIINVAKMIKFEYNENIFKIDLSKTKKK